MTGTSLNADRPRLSVQTREEREKLMDEFLNGVAAAVDAVAKGVAFPTQAHHDAVVKDAINTAVLKWRDETLYKLHAPEKFNYRHLISCIGVEFVSTRAEAGDYASLALNQAAKLFIAGETASENFSRSWEREGRMKMMNDLSMRVKAVAEMDIGTMNYHSGHRLSAAIQSKADEVIRNWLDENLVKKRDLSKYSEVLQSLGVIVDLAGLRYGSITISLNDACRRFVEGKTR